MGPPSGEELIWIEAVELYSDGMHADEVCRRYGITRHRLAQWCDWVDFRVTWVDPGRQPPVPSPAPDYWPGKPDEPDGADVLDDWEGWDDSDLPVLPPTM